MKPELLVKLFVTALLLLTVGCQQDKEDTKTKTIEDFLASKADVTEVEMHVNDYEFAASERAVLKTEQRLGEFLSMVNGLEIVEVDQEEDSELIEEMESYRNDKQSLIAYLEHKESKHVSTIELSKSGLGLFVVFEENGQGKPYHIVNSKGDRYEEMLSFFDSVLEDVPVITKPVDSVTILKRQENEGRIQSVVNVTRDNVPIIIDDRKVEATFGVSATFLVLENEEGTIVTEPQEFTIQPDGDQLIWKQSGWRNIESERNTYLQIVTLENSFVPYSTEVIITITVKSEDSIELDVIY
ncbi:hypothetical protein H0266_02460 [Halobacillus locisalis]|uniref:Uncharacterized protein n=1 Tax=Halobacillus locisalis TaxID=220753 RepID=A0A838CPD5_9BACI|nr:hypothetical protein [Halobacillus locisalis]MBA2173753.1 hypothetical protein [Halobacillus locisalis]